MERYSEYQKAQKWLECYEWDNDPDASEHLATICEALQKAEKTKDKEEQGLLIEKAELERYKLALFGVIRNSKVMPVGMAQGRSMEKINVMALKTMEEVLKMCDFDKMKQFYSEAEVALAKMGGK